jgi:hypothetical protein
MRTEYASTSGNVFFRFACSLKTGVSGMGPCLLLVQGDEARIFAQRSG